jgi:nucleoside-diphosphate-sugar epimerase
MSPRKHALVLGGTGFIGSELVLQLLQKNYRVSVLVHERAPYRQFEDCNLIPSELSEFDLASLQHDPPDIAFHLARIPGKGKAGRLKSAKLGAVHNRRLLTESKSLFPELKWVYVSGSLMYGDCGDDWVDENCPMNPMAYAVEYSIAEEPFQNAVVEGTAMMIHPPWILGNASWFKHFYLKVMHEEGLVPQYGTGQEWIGTRRLWTTLQPLRPGRNSIQ